MPVDLPSLVARRLRQVRLSRGVTQADLSDRTGIAPAEISKFENNHRAPTLESLAKLAEGLSVSPHAFLQADDAVELGPTDAVDRIAHLLSGAPPVAQRQALAIVEALLRSGEPW